MIYLEYVFNKYLFSIYIYIYAKAYSTIKAIVMSYTRGPINHKT